jgi:stage IV sporulation protein FB
MRALGETPQEMRFTAFGIDLVRQGEERSYLRDALVSFAGPAANLAAAGLCYALFQRKYELFFMMNLLLFGLNILPVAPLDGGQAMCALLCRRLAPDTAGRIVEAVSFFVLIPLALAGFFVLLRSRWNFTLLFAACYLTVLLMMKREH